MGRYLEVSELLSCQGIWRTDSENLTAFDKMVRQEKMAHELAGNAMTSTVAQGDAWRDATPFNSVEPSANPDPPAPSAPPVEASSGPSSVSATDQRMVLQTEEGTEECQGKPVSWTPRFRLRGKTSLFNAQKKRKKRGAGPGNKRGKGKSKMPTIYEKEMIMQAYENAKKAGEKKPIEQIRKMRGFFPGCVYPSKWGGQRDLQQWSLLVRCCPKLCHKHKELPNALRKMLDMQSMKRSMQTTSCSKSETVHIPWPLQVCIEDLIMDRIQLGEEVTMTFAKNTLVFAVELWNESLTSMHALLKKKSIEYLHKGDAALADLEPAELDQKLNAVLEKAHDLLKPIQMSNNEEALL